MTGRQGNGYADYDDDFGFGGYHGYHFRDPEEVFREFFGGRDPFAEFFSGNGRSAIAEGWSISNLPFLYIIGIHVPSILSAS